MRNLSEVTKVLISAKERIKDERHWIKGRAFADMLGRSVPAADAERYCMIGTLQMSGYRKDVKRLAGNYCKILAYLLRAIQEKTGGCINLITMSNFNDDPGTTHKDVLSVFDRAIELSIGGKNEAAN